MLNLSIIIPAYNEEKTIIELLKKVAEVNLDEVNKEVIVIDDFSSDNTLKLLEQNKDLFTNLIKLKKNMGKGAAVKEGLSIAKEIIFYFKMQISNMILVTITSY